MAALLMGIAAVTLLVGRSAAAQNVVVNGTFTSNISSWYARTDRSTSPSSATWVSGTMQITTPSGGGTSLWVQPVRVQAGATYLLSGSTQSSLDCASNFASLQFYSCVSDAPCLSISGSSATSIGSDSRVAFLNWGQSASWSSQSTTVVPDTTYGYVLLEAYCDTPHSGSANAAAFDNIALTGQSAPPPTATFTATPPSINAGQTSTLSWSTTNATSVMIDNGVGTQPTSGSITVSPTTTTTYSLTATGIGGSITKQVTITVSTPPAATFSASPASIAAGASSTLAWTTANATSVTIDHGLGSEPLNGSIAVTPGATTTYTLTATGAGGTVTKQATVTVNDPPVITFAASPTSITTGQSSTLSWTTTNATSVSIDNGIGAQPLAGSFIVSPAATTTYTLTATGAGGTRTATATVSVGPPGSPQITFSASPGTIAAGGSATLTWTTTNATAVSIDHGLGARPLSGSVVVSPTQTTTYTLTATGSGGTRTATATVTIARAPTIVFTATPPAVLPGGSVKLEWQVFDATFVVIDPDLGAQPLSGAVTITPKATTIYTLMATGIGGVRSMTVTVAVGGKRRAAKH